MAPCAPLAPLATWSHLGPRGHQGHLGPLGAWAYGTLAPWAPLGPLGGGRVSQAIRGYRAALGPWSLGHQTPTLNTNKKNRPSELAKLVAYRGFSRF